MNEPLLIFAANIISWPYVGIAVAVILLLAIGITFFIRSSSKKKEASTDNANNWQPGNTNSWNSQQGQQNSWGGQQNQWNTSQPQQQQQANPWGNPAQPQAQTQTQAAGQWGSSPQQPPVSNPWGNPAQPQNANAWENAAPQQQDAWGQPQNAAPQQQDAWGQPQVAQQQWGGGAQSPSSFGGTTPSGPSWGQPQAQSQPGQDQWATPSVSNQQPNMQQAQPAPVPSWQQSGYNQSGQQGFNQPGMANFAADGDKTVLRPNPSSSQQISGIGYVQVKEGKEPGRIYEVRKESLSIGRSRESDIFLEDLAVSRLHASIVNMGNGNYALKDEGSANGTKVNDQVVDKFKTYPLQVGDRVQLGQTVLVFARH